MFEFFLQSSCLPFLGRKAPGGKRACFAQTNPGLGMERVKVKYLLDTAPWINGVTLPQVIPERIRRLMATKETKGLCSISLLETAILYRLGRLESDSTLEEFFAVGLSADLQLLELTPAIAGTTNNLGAGFQGDPFDRTIVATAAALDLTLITSDEAIRDSHACRVEYYPFKRSRASR
jgi:PIN domain nuclease of toxin-antitoxin system